MKKFILCFPVLLTAMWCGCRSTSTPASARTTGPVEPPAWSAVYIGETRQQVYDALGTPLLQSPQMARWKGPEFKVGWPSSTHWRVLDVEFDAHDRVAVTRGYEQQK